jgi:hypothetical protein
VKEDLATRTALLPPEKRDEIRNSLRTEMSSMRVKNLRNTISKLLPKLSKMGLSGGEILSEAEKFLSRS